MLVDTHCHLDFPEFNHDRDEVIRRAQEQGVGLIINIGSSLQGSAQSVELAAKYDSLYAAVGIHPHEADSFSAKDRDKLKELAKKDKVVAVGEIGLDYYKNYSQAANQRQLFASLLGLAKELNLPAVIHSREAAEDTLKMLKENMPSKVVVHCFSGNSDFLRQCLELGFFISFTCNITYKKAQGLRDLIRGLPLDRLMLETDAPFLAPEGLRGRRNEPAYVKNLAEEVARIRAASIEEVASATTRNAKEFFNLR